MQSNNKAHKGLILQLCRIHEYSHVPYLYTELQ